VSAGEWLAVVALCAGMPLNRRRCTCGAAATIVGSHLAEACGTSIHSMEMARIDPDSSVD
jgi:hypothetical protein